MEKEPEPRLSRVKQIERDIERLKLELSQLQVRVSEGITNESGRPFETERSIKETRERLLEEIATLEHERTRYEELSISPALSNVVSIPRRITSENTQSVLSSSVRRARR